MSQETFSSTEVLEMAGITYRQLWNWAARGYVRPEERVFAGSGYPYRWSPGEAAQVVKMARLVRLGFAPAHAAQITRRIATTP
jgi:DNA-binding transcriptional MerR regulator